MNEININNIPTAVRIELAQLAKEGCVDYDKLLETWQTELGSHFDQRDTILAKKAIHNLINKFNPTTPINFTILKPDTWARIIERKIEIRKFDNLFKSYIETERKDLTFKINDVEDFLEALVDMTDQEKEVIYSIKNLDFSYFIINKVENNYIYSTIFFLDDFDRIRIKEIKIKILSTIKTQQEYNNSGFSYDKTLLKVFVDFDLAIASTINREFLEYIKSQEKIIRLKL